MYRIKKPSFEDCVHIIDQELAKRKNKWRLSSINYIDFDDIKSIIRNHIWTKWNQYDPRYPLVNWINRIISNQISNLIRNNYGNFAPPCYTCSGNEGADLCKFYEKKGPECPLYFEWEKNKKAAYDTKLPLPLENHSQEVYNKSQDFLDLEHDIEKLHNEMQKTLKPYEWRAYKLLYIQNKSEEEAARQLGYITSEKNRCPGYKQMINIKKAILSKAKKCLYEDNIDIY